MPRRSPRTIVGEHESWRARCINLIPSENVMSPQVGSILASDMGHRYTLPRIGEMGGTLLRLWRDLGEPLVENAYRGTRYLDEVEELAVDLACDVYGCKYSCVRPLSGHVSAMIALSSVCGRGDLIMSVDFSKGGYPGYDSEQMAGMLGLDVDHIPFNDAKCDIDYGPCIKKIVGSSPKAVILGASKMLFPPQIGRLKDACQRAGSNILYDASHVLGLLAGGRFGKPFDEGADLVYGSTHKSFFGPQGGMILTDRRDLMTSVENNLHWKTVDNAHWNRIACIAQVLLELKEFGGAYAGQVVANAKRLARKLDERGFPVQFRELGYTESHQVGLDAEDVAKAAGMGTFEEVAKRLEEADIIIDCVARLGTSECTHLGMKEGEMDLIAELIARVIMEGEDTSSVREDVHELRSRFQKTKFCFD